MTSMPPTRSRVVLITDRVVGIALALLVGFVALLMLAYMGQFAGLGGEGSICDGVAADGLRCSPAFLSAMVIIGYAFVIFGWFVTTGIMIVRFLRKKIGWFLPLIGLVVIIAGYYLVAVVLSSSYLPAG